MNHRLFATTLLLFTLPSYALAQNASLQPKPDPLTAEELSESVQAMKESVGALQEQVKQLTEAVAGNSSNIAGILDQQKTVAEKLQEISDGLGQTQKDQLEHANTIKEINVQLGQIQEFKTAITNDVSDVRTQLGQISQGTGNSSTIRFDNIQDESTLQQFQNLVKRATPQQGTLIVENKMSSVQYIRINRNDYYLAAGEERAFDVPIGNVNTQLLGQKVVNWTIAAPDFKAEIQIVPESQPPQSSAPVPVVGQPVYVDPVTYVTQP